MRQLRFVWGFMVLVVAAIAGAGAAHAGPAPGAPAASVGAAASSAPPAAPPPAVPPPAPPAPAPAAIEAPPAAPRLFEGPPRTAVTRVYVRREEDRAIELDHGGLGDVLFIEMGDGDTGKLHRFAKASKQELAVFFDGQQLTGLVPRPVSVEQHDVFRVELKRTPENRDAWASLLGGRLFSPRRVRVRIGLDNGVPLSDDAPFRLAPFSHRVGPLILLGAVAFTLLTLWLARRSTMIRDGLTADGTLGSFSLSRTQAAFWFVQIVIAFFWIWAVTGEADTITESSLALLGIGSGTALGGKLIDANRNSSQPDPVLPSRGILNDLLTDGDGYALHRFQMLIWSLVLSVLFWSSVYKHLAMPDFDATVLGLMGISSGTYLGFKLPENPRGAKPDEKTDVKPDEKTNA